MIGASDFNTMDLVSLFPVAFVNDFCGLFESVETTKVFTLLVELVNCVLIKVLEPGWSADKISILKRYHLFQNMYMPDVQCISTTWNGQTEVACSRSHLGCNKGNGRYDIFACRSF